MIGADDILVHYMYMLNFSHHEFYNSNVDSLPIFGGLLNKF